VALRRLQPIYRDRVLSAASYWDLARDELAALADGPRKVMGHACEFETSMVLALRPELVRKDQIRNDLETVDPALRGLYLADDMRQRTDHGAVGYCELATAEKGRRMIEAAAGRVTEVVQGLLRKKLPACTFDLGSQRFAELHCPRLHTVANQPIIAKAPSSFLQACVELVGYPQKKASGLCRVVARSEAGTAPITQRFWRTQP